MKSMNHLIKTSIIIFVISIGIAPPLRSQATYFKELLTLTNMLSGKDSLNLQKAVFASSILDQLTGRETIKVIAHSIRTAYAKGMTPTLIDKSVIYHICCIDKFWMYQQSAQTGCNIKTK